MHIANPLKHTQKANRGNKVKYLTKTTQKKVMKDQEMNKNQKGAHGKVLNMSIGKCKPLPQ